MSLLGAFQFESKEKENKNKKATKVLGKHHKLWILKPLVIWEKYKICKAVFNRKSMMNQLLILTSESETFYISILKMSQANYQTKTAKFRILKMFLNKSLWTTLRIWSSSMRCFNIPSARIPSQKMNLCWSLYQATIVKIKKSKTPATLLKALSVSLKI